MVKKAESRKLNGYICVLRPDHPRAMHGNAWDGYVYEHIVVLEEDLGRPLRKNEVGHHLDEDRSNNNVENLIALTKGHHIRLHNWLRLTDGRDKKRRYCACKKFLKRSQDKWCSVDCRVANTPTKRPSREELSKQIFSKKSFLELGRMYDVSSTAVVKWARAYGLPDKRIRTRPTEKITWERSKSEHGTHTRAYILKCPCGICERYKKRKNTERNAQRLKDKA